jgi:8-oxo-dGTP pyrophosphatase MutT (NUDIX family)
MTTAPATPVAAASVIPLRDGETGPEVLLLERSGSLSFAAGAWVFPGGRVDATDLLDEADPTSALRRAAVREAKEEAGLDVDEATLVPFAHWTPPVQAPKRFDTWLFLAAVSPGVTVAVDDGEIVAYRWTRPDAALRLCAEGDMRLFPPTWIALWDLSRYESAFAAVDDIAGAGPRYFVPRVVMIDGTRVALYEGDAAYDDGDPGHTGARHRLSMLDAGWHYERDS